MNSDELYYNVCWWVALFDELDNGTKCCDVEKLFFNKNKLKFDIEHIVPQSEIIKMDNERNKIYNGIGNKMLLDSDINRKIQDDMKKKYMYYCDSKLFLPKQIRECNYRDGVIYWTDEDVKKRTEKIQEIFKYRFINQADTF